MQGKQPIEEKKILWLKKIPDSSQWDACKTLQTVGVYLSK